MGGVFLAGVISASQSEGVRYERKGIERAVMIDAGHGMVAR